jgi:APA family basic amino acid/polyamine antiporter
MWVAKSGAIATLATGFFLYLANFFPALEGNLLSVGPLSVSYGQIAAIGVVLSLAVLNYFGVRLGGGVQVAVTAIKVGCILWIVWVGLTSPAGNTANFSTFVPAKAGVAGFFAAMVAALWAYDGWNNVTMVASEVRHPQRNLPLALTAGTVAVILIYLATNIAYFYILPADQVAAGDRVAAAMMRAVRGEWGAAAVSVAAMISMFAAINGSILTGSRVPYAMARDGLFFRGLSRVHENYRTPARSIIALGLWASVLVLTGRYEDLFNFVIFSSWILYAMAAASVIVLRKKRPNLPRPYRTIGYPVIPIVFILVAIALLVNTLQERPLQSLGGLGLIAAGVPFYFYWKSKQIPN